jgi:NAD-dependent SIR2 family protein deacetylase
MQMSDQKVKQLKELIENADAIIIGAGAGLSASAGYDYSGERFEKYFGDLGRKYGFSEMYEGGFYPYPTCEQYWAYWSRFIYINRYMPAPLPLYGQLLSLVKDKDYFVLTTNVDHCFQKAGFDKNRLFYTQGDYGLFQAVDPKEQITWDNKDDIEAMLLAQGFVIEEDGTLTVPENTVLKDAIPSDLIPVTPYDQTPARPNLRDDDTFVEDAGWHAAKKRYGEFLEKHSKGKVLYLELGVGWNTPGIIKYPFWQMTYQWPNATYACLNFGEAIVPEVIRKKSICINADIGEILEKLS